MSLTRLHFTVDDIIINKKKSIFRIDIVYAGANKYMVKASDLGAINLGTMNNDEVFKETIEHPYIKGNGRKSFAKLRDLAMNVVENKGYHCSRA